MSSLKSKCSNITRTNPPRSFKYPQTTRAHAAGVGARNLSYVHTPVYTRTHRSVYQYTSVRNNASVYMRAHLHV